MVHSKELTPQKLIPYGLLVTKKWLTAQGLSRSLLDNWLKSGKISPVAHGVYKQPEAKLTWEGIVCSLQRMGFDLTPGGLTVLNLNGLSHYLELSEQTTIHLYGTDKMPGWVNKALDNVDFIHHSDLWPKHYINNSYNISHEHLTQNDPLHSNALNTEWPWWGENDDWPLTVSTLEQAWFEVLKDVPDKISFEHADQLMEGLINLSPRRLNKLMDRCENVKIRRLFLWFAERHGHAWIKKIDTDKFTMESGYLGSGKRMLAKDGKLDAKYLITVPKDMHEQEHNLS